MQVNFNMSNWNYMKFNSWQNMSLMERLSRGDSINKPTVTATDNKDDCYNMVQIQESSRCHSF